MPEMVCATPYIREECRHPSQIHTDNADGPLVFKVQAEEPSEVLCWAMRWGSDFEVLESGWRRGEAIEKVRGMMGRNGMREKG